MSNVRILEEQRQEVGGSGTCKIEYAIGDALLIQEYLQQNPGIKLHQSIRARFSVSPLATAVADELVDLFAKVHVDGEPSADPKRTHTVTVTGNREAIRDFAIKHADKVALLKPESMRNELLDFFEGAVERLEDPFISQDAVAYR